ncbi:MAG: transcriptional regulator NrdR [Candidatus Hydrothermarchaeaceae archaeon]
MKCPYCAEGDSRVIDTREVSDAVRRRRECLSCGQRFTTYERVASVSLMVVKRDGRREEFDRGKLLEGIRKACAKRPIPAEVVEGLAGEVEAELYKLGRAEVDSRLIGEMVMERLRELDDVAYVRFASVYRRFADVESLAEEIEELMERRRREEELEAQLRLSL